MCKASKLYLPFQKILPLSDSEKLVLSKGLNFVPISEKTDEFLVKQDVEKFLRRVQLKAFFCEKEGDSNTSNWDTFKTLKNVATISTNLNSIATPNFTKFYQPFFERVVGTEKSKKRKDMVQTWKNHKQLCG